MKTLYLYTMLLLLGCSGCKTDILSPKEELPPATQEGNNRFGCLVNGEVWIPRRWVNRMVYSIGWDNDSFNLVAYRKRPNKNIDQTIAINIGRVQQNVLVASPQVSSTAVQWRRREEATLSYLSEDASFRFTLAREYLSTKVMSYIKFNPLRQW